MQHSIDINIKDSHGFGRRVVAELKRNGNFHTLNVDGSLAPDQMREVILQQLTYVVNRMVDDFVKEGTGHGNKG